MTDNWRPGPRPFQESTDRDTQFLGAAAVLYQRLSDLSASETIIDEDLNGREKQEQLRVIAQWGYDMVTYALRFHESAYDIIDTIPDWPKDT